MQEPEVYCPKCGRRATVIVWFTDEPGEGFGGANCPECGALDYTVRHGRVTRTLLANPEDYLESEPDLLSREEYDRMTMELLLEQGLL